MVCVTQCARQPGLVVVRQIIIMPARAIFTLSNLFGGLRFTLAFVLVLLAFSGTQLQFLVVLAIALLLDAIDGPIARYLHQQSEQGARLDSVADFSVYIALVIGVWQLWPQQFSEQSLYIGIAAASMLLPLLVALIKFRTYTSYHTWLVKFATVCIALGTFILLSGGTAVPFMIASMISALAGIEQVAITLLLARPQADVGHLVAVYRQKKSGSGRHDDPG